MIFYLFINYYLFMSKQTFIDNKDKPKYTGHVQEQRLGVML